MNVYMFIIELLFNDLISIFLVLNKNISKKILYIYIKYFGIIVRVCDWSLFGKIDLVV